MNSYVAHRSVNKNRRLLLQSGLCTISAGGLTSISSLLLPPNALAALPKISIPAKIVIAGAGAAGLSIASHLAARLDEKAEIIIIDSRIQHYYQPGFTLVAAGLKPAEYTISQTANYLPPNVKWVQAHVAEFDPDSNTVTTNKGEKISYDYLFVATGLKLNYAAIAGMDENLIGKNGLGSIYHSPEGAFKTWQMLDQFAQTGGIAIFQRPNTEMKCAGAPLKYTLITRDVLRRRGTLNKSKIIYNSNNKALFSVPIVSEKVRMLFKQRGIDTHYDRQLVAIDPHNRVATFADKAQGRVDYHYDFINVIPPMTAPDAVKNSALSWRQGIWQDEGWVEVDKSTLRHVRYRNVFAIGDIAGVPKGKTAASVKWQVPVAVEHLLADLQGKQSDARYWGYTSCPLITQIGKAMLVEFDYENNLYHSFPGVIAPLEEQWASWLIETIGLKSTYLTMLRGLA
ncbi:FAD-dependent pyridine nucleotide-disulfide oxidoreductase [Bibersteinia trehalosi USDA-ARS-USMARC-190]|uniref:FAD-dependent pyridine nucleotide-disulfide oxidoreductase n=1 Tax=Bibersteinia trehalosi USDA-ARS-USMARC-190 TaxID=1263832 RepID=W0R9C5_BIBTR|nr:FAD/NAD(P)-binding oxidoreductase [Bibersteinia trehalosi]AHG87057.1 FAD-dependent pyridine nucleotide-disulfide oxidoreductase [Bibersteinia trehalosi USDA-ARS-USMARC-190]